MHSYVFNAAGKKGLRRLDAQFKRQVLDDREEICKLPYPARSPNVKKLQGGYDADTYRLRSGNYRIVFRIDKSLLKIVDVFDKQAGKRRYR